MARTSLTLAVMILSTAGCRAPVSTTVELGVELASLRQGLNLPGGQPFEGCRADAGACTPYDLAGRISTGRAMWGELGPEARSVTVLGVEADGEPDPSAPPMFFSLINNTALTGSTRPPEPGATGKPVTRMEFDYDYLDATVELSTGGAMDGAWVVRTVFVTRTTAPDVDGELLRGDKLIRALDEPTFQWCGPGGCAARRADVPAPVQEEKLVSYVYPGQGDPDAIPFAVPLSNQLALTGDQLNSAAQTWEVTFDMHHAVLWHTAPGALASRTALLESFELSYAPDQQHAGQDTAISARLTWTGE